MFQSIFAIFSTCPFSSRVRGLLPLNYPQYNMRCSGCQVLFSAIFKYFRCVLICIGLHASANLSKRDRLGRYGLEEVKKTDSYGLAVAVTFPGGVTGVVKLAVCAATLILPRLS